MKRFIVAVLLLAVAPDASANDSSSAIGLGGLELTKNDAISMDSEDLFLSLEKVTVKYRFTNHSDKDVETLISFPLPAVPDGIDGYLGDTSYPDWKEHEFRTLVNGKPIALDYREVVTAGGKNVEARLKELGWPVKFWKDYAFVESVEKFSDAYKARYLAEGLLKKPEPDQDWTVPGWQVATYVTRTQKFPAGKTVMVEHSYKPIAGGSVGGLLGALATPESMAGDGGEGIREWAEAYKAKHCIDDAFLKGFRNKTAAKRKQGEREGTEMGQFYVEHWLKYILKPGANWRGPIKNFRMVIDKGNADNLVSLCADGVKKIGPTQFEVRKTDFEPKDDLDILIIEWPKSE